MPDSSGDGTVGAVWSGQKKSCAESYGDQVTSNKKTSMGFFEVRDVTNCGFPCLIRKFGLSIFTFCHAFLGCYISTEMGQGLQGAVSCRVGMCQGDLQLSLPRPDLLLLLSDEALWLQGVDVITS